jgi:hypothetical protein
MLGAAHDGPAASAVGSMSLGFFGGIPFPQNYCAALFVDVDVEVFPFLFFVLPIIIFPFPSFPASQRHKFSYRHLFSADLNHNDNHTHLPLQFLLASNRFLLLQRKSNNGVVVNLRSTLRCQ